MGGTHPLAPRRAAGTPEARRGSVRPQPLGMGALYQSLCGAAARMRGIKLALLVVAVSAAMALFILHYVKYPYPIWRGLIFQHLLFHQDLVGLALIGAIAIAACVPKLQGPAL